jgi:hypothetical protein
MVRDLNPLNSPNKGKIYGICEMCGERVRGSHQYITAEEGYCHRKCIEENQVVAMA